MKNAKSVLSSCRVWGAARGKAAAWLVLSMLSVSVRIADAEGLTVPRSDNLVTFKISGPGKIVAVDNGDATSFEPFQANRRKAFNGLALVILRAQPGQRGTIQLMAESESLRPAQIVLSAKRDEGSSTGLRP